MKKRIMFVLGSLGFGGAERVISILSNYYAMNGWEVSICLLLSSVVSYKVDDNVHIIDLSGNTAASRIRRFPSWVSGIRQYSKKWNPDVIVSFAARINVITIIACIGLGKKIVVSERNDPKHDGRGLITSIFVWLLYPLSHSVVFQTKRVQSYFSRRIQKKSVIIPNPIEVNCYSSNINPDKIVSVGNLKTQKNHALLISAFCKVNELYPSKKLYIIGEGELRKQLETQIMNLGLRNSVFLLGHSSNVHEEIRDALFFVLSSDYEGLSNALLEAMMMGIPCISTNCAGSDEFIHNGENGLLVEVGDVKALEYAMIRYIEDNELRIRCGNEAKNIKMKVGLDVTINQWKQALEL